MQFIFKFFVRQALGTSRQSLWWPIKAKATLARDNIKNVNQTEVIDIRILGRAVTDKVINPVN